MTDCNRYDAGTAGAKPSSPVQTRCGRRYGVGWRDGLFIALAAAAVAATAAQAGLPFGFAHLPRLLHDLLDPAGGRVVPLSGTVLIGTTSLLGCLLLRLRWRNGLAVVALGWWGLVALALWQERVVGDSVGLPLPAAALAAVYALAVLLRPAERPATSRTGAGSGARSATSSEPGSKRGKRRGRSATTGRDRPLGLKASSAAKA